MLVDKEYVDDEIRASIIKVLEVGNCHSYEEYCDFVKRDIRETLEQYPAIVKCLVELLNEIEEENIVSVQNPVS